MAASDRHDAMREYRTVIHNERVVLTQEQYRTLMCDVEAVRYLEREENAFIREEGKNSENGIAPHGWKLSDSIEDAARRGSEKLGRNWNSVQDKIDAGIEAMRELIKGHEPCADADADDVFPVN